MVASGQYCHDDSIGTVASGWYHHKIALEWYFDGDVGRLVLDASNFFSMNMVQYNTMSSNYYHSLPNISINFFTDSFLSHTKFLPVNSTISA